MKIGFLSPKSNHLSHRSFLDPGLGGNETTYVLWAEELGRRGHLVEVYSSDVVSEFRGRVSYLPMAALNSSAELDLLIACRTPAALARPRVAPSQVLMLGDRHVECPEAVTAENCNFIWYVSKAQYARLAFLFDPAVNYIVGSCGVADDLFDLPNEKNRLQFVHSCAPYRGLARLLEIWPKLRQRFPDATLHVTGGYELWGYTTREAAALLSRDLQSRSLDHPNLFLHGPLPRQQYLEIVARSEGFIHVTDYEEMCCIAALEASALGAVPIVSNVAALAERVIHGRSGLSIERSASDNDIVEQVECLFGSERNLRFMSNNCRKNVYKFRTAAMVDQFLEGVRHYVG